MNQSTSAVPVWYWVIAVVALLWNLIGCVAFGSELFAQEAMMASMTDVQKDWVRSIPGWIYFVYGLAVSTGVAGSVGLLVRKRWSTAMFALSLAAVIIQMGHTMIFSNGLKVMGPSAAVMPTLVTVIAVVLLLFSMHSKKRCWLGEAAVELPAK